MQSTLVNNNVLYLLITTNQQNTSFLLHLGNNITLKPGTYTDDKVDCCRNRQQSRLLPIRSTLSPVLATNRQQLEFDSLSRSTFSPTRSNSSPIRSTLSPVCRTSCRHCRQCVYVSTPKRHGRLSRLSTKSTVLNSTLSPVCTGL